MCSAAVLLLIIPHACAIADSLPSTKKTRIAVENGLFQPKKGLEHGFRLLFASERIIAISQSANGQAQLLGKVQTVAAAGVERVGRFQGLIDITPLIGHLLVVPGRTHGLCRFSQPRHPQSPGQVERLLSSLASLAASNT